MRSVEKKCLNAVALGLMSVLCCVVAPVSAFEIDFAADVIPDLPYPGDRVGVPLHGGGNCNSAQLDPKKKPQIRLSEHRVNGVNDPSDDVYTYAVDYWLVDVNDVCGTPPPPRVFYADIGELPLGYHFFEAQAWLNGEKYVEYMRLAIVNLHERAPDDISGFWVAPDQLGRGFTVTRSGDLFLLYWATHDGNGEPTWATLIVEDKDPYPGWFETRTFSGDAVTTSGAPLTPGAAELDVEPWAKVTFTYEGCGRATFEWEALDQPILDPPTGQTPRGNGSLALKQVLVPDGVAPCDVVAISKGLVAEWVESP